MEIIIGSTAEELAAIAAAAIVRQVDRNPKIVLGLATGSTPRPLYAELARAAAAGTDFRQVQGFALDEYVGIAKDHPESYASVIQREVVLPLSMVRERVHVPDGRAFDLAFAGPQYDADIQAAGGIDIQILGIGRNGHIGFNEPGSSLSSRTRVKTLTNDTRVANARFFASVDEVPTHCLTQGLGTIMDARRVFLFAFGEAKAEAIANALEGPLSASCPGSVLQLHPHATIFVDEQAAAGLTHAEYYRYAYAHKPDWQEL